MSITRILFTLIVFPSLDGAVRGGNQLCCAEVCYPMSSGESKQRIIVSSESSRIHLSVRTNFTGEEFPFR